MEAWKVVNFLECTFGQICVWKGAREKDREEMGIVPQEAIKQVQSLMDQGPFFSF